MTMRVEGTRDRFKRFQTLLDSITFEANTDKSVYLLAGKKKNF